MINSESVTALRIHSKGKQSNPTQEAYYDSFKTIPKHYTFTEKYNYIEDFVDK